MRGDAQLDPTVQRRLLETMTPPASSGRGREQRQRKGDPPDGLTRRETEVLRLIAQGHSNAEISAVLFISEATVKTHINNLFAKIGVRDRAQAVTYAYRRGIADT
ncbi:response regulator transcription factor [Streptosporangium lutulentum]